MEVPDTLNVIENNSRLQTLNNLTSPNTEVETNSVLCNIALKGTIKATCIY